MTHHAVAPLAMPVVLVVRREPAGGSCRPYLCQVGRTVPCCRASRHACRTGAEGSWTWGPLPLGHMTDRWRQADPTFRTGFQQPVRDHSQHRTNATHREHHPLARADLAVNATATVSRAGRHRALRRH
ncbi:hypothetical protein B296_00058609 [Ensete ventricosum]|uniref:Uncharacterized protein n=1 Tax=Ensete ventricosum TaxID=4639 RepID=A0A426X2K7_ENSVE|nr:hypothetical protein B296_00058609 [Ensete ventricosum]